MNNSGKHGSGDCSFCGKKHDETKWLIAGPQKVKICGDCVELCVDMIDGWEKGDKRG